MGLRLHVLKPCAVLVMMPTPPTHWLIAGATGWKMMVGIGIDPKGLLVEGGATKIIQAREGPWLLPRAHCLCVFSDHRGDTFRFTGQHGWCRMASATGVEVWPEGRRVCPGPLLS